MATTLVLVPTAFELKIVRDALASGIDPSTVRLECCGFGVIAAAARAAQLMSTGRPQRVILAGISGGLNHRLHVGRAYWFSEVAAYGIGAGAGDQFLTAGEMGWPHWAAPSQNETNSVGDVIGLQPTDYPPESHGGQLLTACAASAHSSDADLRLEKFPAAAAEDMEGFSVALAGELSGVPVEIIRGISNHAGDRHKENWMIRESLIAVAELMMESLA